MTTDREERREARELKLEERDRQESVAWHRRLEVWTAIVLAVAGLASAWASFQGGIWAKEETENFAAANTLTTESSRLFIRAGQEESVFAALFLQYLDAVADGQDKRAAFVKNHMPPHFRTEFDAWRAQQPDDVFDVPPNSKLPSFAGPSRKLAEEKRVEAQRVQGEAHRAGHVGDRYEIANVVLATALFLAGIGTILEQPRAHRLVLVLAGLLTLAAIAQMLFTPMQMQT